MHYSSDWYRLDYRLMPEVQEDMVHEPKDMTLIYPSRVRTGGNPSTLETAYIWNDVRRAA